MTSPSHRSSVHTTPLLRFAARLQTQRAARDKSGLFWVEGIRQFIQAVEGGWEFDTVLVSPILLKSDLAEAMARRHAKTRRIDISPEQFRAVSMSQHASGIGAIAKQRWQSLASIEPNDNSIFLVIESIRSEGNLGTIIRTAEATGVAALIFLSPSLDLFDPAVIRASMGGLFHVPVVRTTHTHFADWASQRDIQTVGLAPAAPDLWTAVPIEKPIALLIGEERKGLTERALSLCRQTVRLPMSGRADSLNVAVATGAMLYELIRGRGARHAH